MLVFFNCVDDIYYSIQGPLMNPCNYRFSFKLSGSLLRSLLSAFLFGLLTSGMVIADMVPFTLGRGLPASSYTASNVYAPVVSSRQGF